MLLKNVYLFFSALYIGNMLISCGWADAPTDKKNEKKDSEKPISKNEGVKTEDQPYDFFPVTAESYQGAVDKTQSNDATPETQKIPQVTGYFSPTCGHCGNFFKKELAPTILDKYITADKLTFSIRPFCMHTMDFKVTRLALSKGAGSFVFLFKSFMENQDDWLEFLTTDAAQPISAGETELVTVEVNDKKDLKKGKEKIVNKDAQAKEDQAKKDRAKRKADLLITLQKKYNIADTDTRLTQLHVGPDNDNSSIIVMALSLGLTVDEIKKALPEEGASGYKAAEAMDLRLFATLMQAVDEKGNPVTGIPAFYVDNKFKEVLSLKEFALIADGKDVPGPDAKKPEEDKQKDEKPAVVNNAVLTAPMTPMPIAPVAMPMTVPAVAPADLSGFAPK